MGFSVFYLLLILSPWRVQRLDEGRGVPDKHGIAGGTHDHAQHGQPNIRHALRSLSAVSDAQHVTHGLEQSVGVLHAPRVILRQTHTQMNLSWRFKPICFGCVLLSSLTHYSLSAAAFANYWPDEVRLLWRCFLIWYSLRLFTDVFIVVGTLCLMTRCDGSPPEKSSTHVMEIFLTWDSSLTLKLLWDFSNNAVQIKLKYLNFSFIPIALFLMCTALKINMKQYPYWAN